MIWWMICRPAGELISKQRHSAANARSKSRNKTKTKALNQSCNLTNIFSLLDVDGCFVQRSVRLVAVTASVCDQTHVSVPTDKQRQPATLYQTEKMLVLGRFINMRTNILISGFANYTDKAFEFILHDSALRRNRRRFRAKKAFFTMLWSCRLFDDFVVEIGAGMRDTDGQADRQDI